MNEIQTIPHEGQRGRPDHHVRDQIVTAANEHFSRFGYGKTTMADLAKSINFSKAYIYKFFDSKQAIGEAICTQCLSSIIEAANQSFAIGDSATERFRKLVKTVSSRSRELFFSDRQLYDIASFSTAEKWESSLQHERDLRELLKSILLLGRESGEFERKTPLDETCRAILLALQPFTNPLILQYNLDVTDEERGEVVSLVLRSLSP